MQPRSKHRSWHSPPAQGRALQECSYGAIPSSRHLVDVESIHDGEVETPKLLKIPVAIGRNTLRGPNSSPKSPFVIRTKALKALIKEENRTFVSSQSTLIQCKATEINTDFLPVMARVDASLPILNRSDNLVFPGQLERPLSAVRKLHFEKTCLRKSWLEDFARGSRKSSL